MIITRISLGHVVSHDKELFNVNNLWKDNKMPSDYSSALSSTNTINWIDLFHKDNYGLIIIDKNKFGWMKNALSIGQMF